jgi:hypothetical protein
MAFYSNIGLQNGQTWTHPNALTLWVTFAAEVDCEAQLFTTSSECHFQFRGIYHKYPGDHICSLSWSNTFLNYFFLLKDNWVGCMSSTKSKICINPNLERSPLDC